jgi:membrane fusion protein (multidrug efflux system)
VSSRRNRAQVALLWAVLAASPLAGGCESRTSPGDGANADATPPAAETGGDSSAAASTPEDPTFETALVPLHDVEIFARAEGPVVALDVEEGRRVVAGARLAQLDDRERRATRDMRKAEEERAEAAWQRAQQLRQQNVISDEQHIAARSEWQIARAQRDRAQAELERCAVTTPIRGLVEQRRVQMGQTVKEGDLLFRIGNPDTLRAELLLPEERLGTVRVGQPVLILTKAGGVTTRARVTRVNPLVDPASGTFRVVIDIDNRSGRLAGGVSARVVLDGVPATPR